MTVTHRSDTPLRRGRKRLVKLCPAVEKMIRDNPPYIGLTGDALRWMIERAIKAQRQHDMKDKDHA